MEYCFNSSVRFPKSVNKTVSYPCDTGNMNTVLETMVKRGTLTDEQITEIKEQRKS